MRVQFQHWERADDLDTICAKLVRTAEEQKRPGLKSAVLSSLERGLDGSVSASSDGFDHRVSFTDSNGILCLFRLHKRLKIYDYFVWTDIQASYTSEYIEIIAHPFSNPTDDDLDKLCENLSQRLDFN